MFFVIFLTFTAKRLSRFFFFFFFFLIKSFSGLVDIYTHNEASEKHFSGTSGSATTLHSSSQILQKLCSECDSYHNLLEWKLLSGMHQLGSVISSYKLLAKVVSYPLLPSLVWLASSSQWLIFISIRWAGPH